MIIDKIIEMIYHKRRDVMMKENRDVNLVVYIENNLWYEMMDELVGQLSSTGFDVYQNNGDKIMGFPIFRVITKGHGIKVFEV